MEIKDTDRIRLDRKLRKLLDENTVDGPNGCRIYRPEDCTVQRAASFLEVTVYGDHPDARRKASAPRVAWALAHPEDHLGVDDVAVHTCDGRYEGIIGVCVNTDHIRKGTWSDVRKK